MSKVKPCMPSTDYAMIERGAWFVRSEDYNALRRKAIHYIQEARRWMRQYDIQTEAVVQLEARNRAAVELIETLRGGVERYSGDLCRAADDFLDGEYEGWDAYE